MNLGGGGGGGKGRPGRQFGTPPSCSSTATCWWARPTPSSWTCSRAMSSRSSWARSRSADSRALSEVNRSREKRRCALVPWFRKRRGGAADAGPGAMHPAGFPGWSGAPRAVRWTARLFQQIGVTRRGNQRSEKTVGAGSESSAVSWLLLRGVVIHHWSLRIPLQSRWICPAEPARAAAGSTPLFTGGNGSS